ncbi:MAG: DNA methyltransferase [Candidatus Poribacteria bacterium]|nr:DNA methyltransferase [Candidatus Poribacteria bacterium]
MNIANKTIFTGDNLPILRGINSECIDLIYLDPPFNSNANYAAPIGSQAAGAEFKDTWSLSDLDVAWLDLIETKYSAVNRVIQAAMTDSDKSYLVYMATRLLEMHRILKTNGSIYLHCDPTMSHYLKLLLDAIFGRKNFQNEIVWSHQGTWIQPNTKYPRRHDTLFFYTKTDDYTFNLLYEDDAKEQVNYKRWRKYLVDNTIYGRNMPTQDTRFHTYLNKFREEHGREPNDDDPVLVITGSRIGTVQYIKAIDPKSDEWTGYPTQKPLALLDRIIKTSTNKGGIVFDPFCGCATACVAADRLLRNWVGIDIAPKAVELVVERIKKDQGLFQDINHRTDIPHRSDLGRIPPYNTPANKTKLYGEQSGNCNGCNTHFETQHLEIDHIIAKSVGGTDHIGNLQLLCGNCNRIKGNRGQEYLIAKLAER